MPTLQLAIDARRAKEGAAEFSDATKQAQREATSASASIDKLDKSLEEIKTSGQAAQKQLTSAILAIEGISRQSNKTADDLARLEKGVTQTNENVHGLQVGLKGTKEELADMAAQAKPAAEEISHLSDSSGHAAQSVGFLAKVVGGVVLALEALKQSGDFVQHVIDVEKAMVDTSKATDLAGQELRNFVDDLNQLSTHVPLSTEKLLALAGQAGQLGIRGSDNLLKFTTTAAKMGTSTALAADKAVTALGRILLSTGEPIDVVDKLGSSIVALASSTRASEAVIADSAESIAKSTASFKLTSREVIALAATMTSLGFEGERSATVLTKTFRALDTVVRSGGEKLKILAGIAGQTSEEFAKLFEQNPLQGLIAFTTGLDRLSRSGGDVTGKLTDLGLKNEQLLRTLPVLASHTDDLTRALGLANQEFIENTALSKGAERTYATLGDKLALFGNAAKAAIPTDFTGGLKSIIDFGTSTIRILSGMADSSDRAKTAAVILARAIQVITIELAAFAAYKTILFLLSLKTAIENVTGALIILELVIKRNPFIFWASVVAAAATALSFIFFPATEKAADGVENLHKEVLTLEASLGRLKSVEASLDRALAIGDKAAELDAVNQKIRELESASVSAFEKLRETRDATVENLGKIKGIDGKLIAKRLVDDLVQGLENQDTAAIGRFYERSLTPESGTAFQVRAALVRTIRESISNPLNNELALAAAAAKEKLLGFINVDKLPAVEAIKVLEDQIVSLKEQAKGLSLPTVDDETLAQRKKEQAEILKSKEALDALIESIKLERDLIGQGPESRAQIVKLREAESLAIKAGIADRGPLLESLRAEILLNQELDREADKRARDEVLRSQAAKSLDEYVNRLREETALLRLSSDEREVQVALQQAEAIARKGNLELTKEQISAIRSEIEEQRRLRDAAELARKGITYGPPVAPEEKVKLDKKVTTAANYENEQARLDELIQSFNFEKSVVNATNEERERAIFLRDLEKAAIQAQATNVDELVHKYDKEFTQFQRMRQLRELGQSLGQTIGQSFEDIVFHVGNAREAINALGRDIARQAFNSFVTKPLSQIVGNVATSFFQSFAAPSAKGNIFSSGQIVPHAYGDILTEPTFFPMANGKTGLGGEAGPEAILPLKRAADGSLGVKLSGEDRHREPRTITRNEYKINVYAKDADSFRRSERQLINSLKKRAR